MNLFERFAALKKQVGGNWEKEKYEPTMGMEVWDKNRITPPSPMIRRILSEVHFALQLSKRLDGRFNEEISAALSLLEKAIEEDGALCNRSCLEAEKLLLPMQSAAKEYEVLYASHAHIDMNWMWGFQETVSITLSTFRTMLNLMKEYPDFTFSQSQASVYKIVEEYDPEMMEEIKARIREGRWEVTANAWVETDKNMPDTESLLRHIRYTRDYLHETWDIAPGSIKVDFSPDTFGHSRFVPEINTFGNVPYYYHCRGLKQDVTLYRYRAPSGKEVLMYKEPYWYNSGVNPDNGTGIFEIERRCAGLKTALIVYGVGNHGGGPTRRDIERILEMQNWPIFPRLSFGTLHEYFARAEKVRQDLPVVDHELNAIFTGCYTTQSRIKLANRRAEAALLDSEKMSALSHCILGTPFHAEQYESAWQKVLFCHFHDILTGSCVQESREHAMGQLAQAIATAQTQQAKAYEQLSQNIDTSMFPAEEASHLQAEGAGAGFGIANYAGVPNPERGAGKTRIYTVFNASSQLRQEMVEITVWDYAGSMAEIEMMNHQGEAIPFQLLDDQPQRYWDHYYVRILFEAQVPPLGYAVYALREKERADYPTYLHPDREELPKGPIVLENEYLRATFLAGDGQLHSLINKENGEEMLLAPAGLHLVHTENGGATAWNVGRYLGMESVTETVKVIANPGELRSSVTFEQKVMQSTVKMAVSLDKGARNLSYKLEVDWHEAARNQPFIPLLSYRLPLKNASDILLCDVPAGCAERTGKDLDVPALTGALAKGSGLGLITDCKYGFRLADQVLSVSLINTACDPDPYPERGIHAIRLFVTLTQEDARQMKLAAEALTRPMVGVPTGAHPGKLPPVCSLMEVKSDHSVVTSLQIAKDGALLIRLYEAKGQEDKIQIQLPTAIREAYLTDLDENILAKAEIKEGKAAFTAQPYAIVQAKLIF